MGTQKDIGKNEGIDADVIEDVSFVPDENESETSDEKSDAQRIADGEITVDDGEDEMFVSPDSVYAKKGDEAEPEKKPEEKKPEGKKPEVKKPDEKKSDEKKPAAAPDPIQKRINKITREKYDAQREADRLKKEKEDLEKELLTLRHDKEKAEIDGKKPKKEEFETEDAYYEALGRWAAKSEIHESKKTTPPPEKKAEPEDPREKIVKVGEEAYADFIEVVGSIPLTKETFDALQDSDHAHEILYHLGGNPDLAKKLAEMKSPISIAREIGRIEAQFIEEVPEVVVQLPGKDNELAEKSKLKKKPSSAPEPIKPLGSGGKVGKSLDELSFSEYAEKRGYTRDGMKRSRVS